MTYKEHTKRGKPYIRESFKTKPKKPHKITLNANFLLVPSAQEIQKTLDNVRADLTSRNLESKTKKQLMLLIQRQHIEEEELKLRHMRELERFQTQLDEGE